MKPHSLCLILALFSLTSHAGQPPVHKLLVVGDSITRHAPSPEKLGWSGDWGMAAVSKEKDYVHLFLARLAAGQNGMMPELMIAGGGGGKVTDKVAEVPKFEKFQADLAIIQLGENDNENITSEGFQRPYEKIIEGIRAGNPQAKVFCFGVWSPPNGSSVKDAMIRDVCRKYGATFVDLKAVNADPENKALKEKRFTHDGVNWHPGNKGMDAYAGALWKAFEGGAASSAGDTSAKENSLTTNAVFTEDWSSGGNPAWKPSPRIEEIATKPTACVRSENPDANNQIRIALPVEQIKGRMLEIVTRVKGEEISSKPNRWNGVKVMLRLQSAEGQLDYPQAQIPVGTFDWQEVSFAIDIPDNIVGATLILGLEQVSGTVWFDALKLVAHERSFPNGGR